MASNGNDDKIAVIFIFIIAFYVYFCDTPSFFRPHSNGTNSQDFSSSFKKTFSESKIQYDCNVLCGNLQKDQS